MNSWSVRFISIALIGAMLTQTGQAAFQTTPFVSLRFNNSRQCIVKTQTLAMRSSLAVWHPSGLAGHGVFRHFQWAVLAMVATVSLAAQDRFDTPSMRPPYGAPSSAKGTWRIEIPLHFRKQKDKRPLSPNRHQVSIRLAMLITRDIRPFMNTGQLVDAPPDKRTPEAIRAWLDDHFEGKLPPYQLFIDDERHITPEPEKKIDPSIPLKLVPLPMGSRLENLSRWVVQMALCSLVLTIKKEGGPDPLKEFAQCLNAAIQKKHIASGLKVVTIYRYIGATATIFNNWRYYPGKSLPPTENQLTRLSEILGVSKKELFPHYENVAMSRPKLELPAPQPKPIPKIPKRHPIAHHGVWNRQFDLVNEAAVLVPYLSDMEVRVIMFVREKLRQAGISKSLNRKTIESEFSEIDRNVLSAILNLLQTKCLFSLSDNGNDFRFERLGAAVASKIADSGYPDKRITRTSI